MIDRIRFVSQILASDLLWSFRICLDFEAKNEHSPNLLQIITHGSAILRNRHQTSEQKFEYESIVLCLCMHKNTDVILVVSAKGLKYSRKIERELDALTNDKGTLS